jgi:hypothetical protein
VVTDSVVQHLSYEVIRLIKKNPLLKDIRLITMFEKKSLHPVLDIQNFNICLYIMKYWLDQDILKMKIMTYIYFM